MTLSEDIFLKLSEDIFTMLTDGSATADEYDVTLKSDGTIVAHHCFGDEGDTWYSITIQEIPAPEDEGRVPTMTLSNTYEGG